LQIKAIIALLVGQYEFDLAGDEIASDFQGLVVGPKEPCRVRYRRRAQPSVTMNAAAELSKMASPEAMQEALAVHGGDAHAHGANGHGNGAAAAAKPAKKLRITLDRDLCQGHAVCVGEAPDVFRIGADGKVELALDGDLPLGSYGKVHAAAEYCPTRTIKLRYE
jgi:sterol 14-demethylase